MPSPMKGKMKADSQQLDTPRSDSENSDDIIIHVPETQQRMSAAEDDKELSGADSSSIDELPPFPSKKNFNLSSEDNNFGMTLKN